MNLNEILAENMLRFGTKNLSENTKNYLLLEQNPTGSLDPDALTADEMPDELEDPEDATLSYYKDPLGQRVKQTAQKAGAITKKVVGTATLVAPLSKIIRNRLFKRYIRKNGIPTKEQLIAKDSDRVKSHPAYQQTIDLMYRDKSTLKSASRYNTSGAKQQAGLPVLYWYGVPALGGEANPEDQQAMQSMLTLLASNKELMSSKITDEAKKIEFDTNIAILSNGLQDLYDNGIYITTSDLLEATDGNPWGSFLTQLLKAPSTWTDNSAWYESDPILLKTKSFVAAIKLGVADSGITPKGQKLRKMELESTATLTLSESDKLGILTMFQQRSEANRKPIIDASFWDIEAASIGIKTNKAIETTTIKGASGKVEVTYQFFTLPADPNGVEARNAFFGNSDNETVVNEDGIAKMNSLLNGLIGEAKQQGQRVVSVQYCAGAKTSAVGTTFGMTTKQKTNATDDTKTQANVTLANKRCQSILASIGQKVLPTIKSQPDLGDDKVTYKTIDVAVGGNKGVFAYPNCGPGWYEYDIAGTSDTFKGNGYGPLFNKIYNLLKTNNPKINGIALFEYYNTPRSFYICRNQVEAYKRLAGYLTALKTSDTKKYGTIQIPTQEQIESEYQSVFSPFRGTYAGFLIGTVVETVKEPKPEIDKALEVEIQKFGEFEAIIDWTPRFVRTVERTWSWITKAWNWAWKWTKKINFPELEDIVDGAGSGVQELCNAFD